MFDAIYTVSLNENSADTYQQQWKTIAEYMTSKKGAIQSTFYFCDATHFCLIHSKWPSEDLKKKSWPLGDDAPSNVHEASSKMAACKKNNVTQLTLSLNELEVYLEDHSLLKRDTVVAQSNQEVTTLSTSDKNSNIKEDSDNISSSLSVFFKQSDPKKRILDNDASQPKKQKSSSTQASISTT